MVVKQNVLNDNEVKIKYLTLSQAIELALLEQENPIKNQLSAVLRVFNLILNGNPQNEQGGSLTCMDGRIPKQGLPIVGQAGSGILSIAKFISEGMHKNLTYTQIYQNIYNFFAEIIIAYNIKNITSHQDCGAAKIFVSSLKEIFQVQDMEALTAILKEIFIGISFDQVKTEDDLTRVILKYISEKLGVDFSHIILAKPSSLLPNLPESATIPPHLEDGLVLNFTNRDIFKALGKFPFLKNVFRLNYFSSGYDQHIESITTQQVIISKIIAFSHNNISHKNPMEIVFVVDSEESRILAEKLQYMIYEVISYQLNHLENHPDTIALVDLLRKLALDGKIDLSSLYRITFFDASKKELSQSPIKQTTAQQALAIANSASAVLQVA